MKIPKPISGYKELCCLLAGAFFRPMIDPRLVYGSTLALAGLALSAAGAGYGVVSSEDAQSQMNQDVANTVAGEQKLQQQATPIYQQNLKTSTSQQPSNQGIAQALQGYQDAAQAPISTQPIVDAPPSKTVDARTQADIARQQQASAALQGPIAQQTAWNVGNIGTNAQLGNITAIGSSLASTLQPNLLAAQEQGTTGQAIGGLVGSVGSGVGAYGASQRSNGSYTALLNALNSGQGTSNDVSYNDSGISDTP